MAPRGKGSARRAAARGRRGRHDIDPPRRPIAIGARPPPSGRRARDGRLSTPSRDAPGLRVSYASRRPNAFMSSATMPQSMPPTGHAVQNHMAEVPSDSKFEGSGELSTGANKSPSPTMVATIMMTPHTAPSLSPSLLLPQQVPLELLLDMRLRQAPHIPSSSAMFLLYWATSVRTLIMPK